MNVDYSISFEQRLKAAETVAAMFSAHVRTQNRVQHLRFIRSGSIQSQGTGMLAESQLIITL